MKNLNQNTRQGNGKKKFKNNFLRLHENFSITKLKMRRRLIQFSKKGFSDVYFPNNLYFKKIMYVYYDLTIV